MRTVLALAVPIAGMALRPREAPPALQRPSVAAEVYAAVIRGDLSQLSRAPSAIVVADSTALFDREDPRGMADPAAAWRLFELHRVAELPADVVADYQRRNAQRQVLRGRVGIRSPAGVYPFVSDVRRDTLFVTGESSSFYGAHPFDRILFTFSDVGLSSDGQRALVFRHLHCGGLCGTGELVLLKRTSAGAWEELARAPLWIS